MGRFLRVRTDCWYLSASDNLWSFYRFHSVSRPVSLHGWSAPTPGRRTMQLTSIALERTTWVWLEWLPILKFLVWDDVVSCSDFLFGIFDMCFIRQCSVQCDANIHLEYYTGKSSKGIMAEVFTSRGISTLIIFYYYVYYHCHFRCHCLSHWHCTFNRVVSCCVALPFTPPGM